MAHTHKAKQTTSTAILTPIRKKKEKRNGAQNKIIAVRNPCAPYKNEGRWQATSLSDEGGEQEEKCGNKENGGVADSHIASCLKKGKMTRLKWTWTPTQIKNHSNPRFLSLLHTENFNYFRATNQVLPFPVITLFFLFPPTIFQTLLSVPSPSIFSRKRLLERKTTLETRHDCQNYRSATLKRAYDNEKH